MKSPNYSEPEKYDPSFDYDSHTVIRHYPNGTWSSNGIMRNSEGAYSFANKLALQPNNSHCFFSVHQGVISEWDTNKLVDDNFHTHIYYTYVKGHELYGKTRVSTYFDYDITFNKLMQTEDAREHYIKTRREIEESRK